MALKEFLTGISGLSPGDEAMIERAYRRAEQAHDGQKRRSGEPYFSHCVAVAQILIDLNLDAPSIAAALLHDTVEDTSLTLEDIESEFGVEVARLVDGVTKMEHLPTQVDSKARDREAEYLRKTFLAMDDDVRIVLIKLADRLHNMRTLGYMSPESQRRNAQETMDIFAPLANRLGIWRMKWELEDLSFRYLSNDIYREIAAKIAQRRADRDEEMENLRKFLADNLVEHGIRAEVSARPKHIYSIYRKMKQKGLPFEQIFDIRALRVLVDDKPPYTLCYQILGIVHALWHPIAGEFDDYIAAPKDNFYQSLHTTVYDDQGRALEVQIRTFEMHYNAEYGIAAHWRYKEGSKANADNYEKRLKYLRYLMQFKDDVDDDQDARDFMDMMKSEVFQDRVYAFTPNGDIIDLPTGATPIDFAYYIHTEIGHRCRGARVNGKLVGLDHKLKTGDRVEIITAKRGGPSLDWLSSHTGFTATTRARAKIRAWFRKQNRENNITAGRDALDRELKRLGLSTTPYDYVAGLFNHKSVDDFLAAIGHGDINNAQIASRILDAKRQTGREILDRELERLDRPQLTAEDIAGYFRYGRVNDFLLAVGYADISPAQIIQKIEEVEQAAAEEGGNGSRIKQVDASGSITITGVEGLLVNLARCCNPTPGDEIIGYITRGRGVTVHRSDCKNVINTSEPDRLIHVSWGPLAEKSERTYPVPVSVVAYDRKGLLRDIGAVMADENINMTDVNIATQNNIATCRLVVEISDVTQLSRILAKLERLPNVLEANRLTRV